MKKIRVWIANYLLRNLFCAIVEEEILPWQKLSHEERLVLVEEARLIKSTKLFERLLVSMDTTARKRMFDKSQSWDDMYFGKATLYTVDVLRTKIETLSKLTI